MARSATFVRFVVERLDPKSGRRQGLFQALRHLKNEQPLAEEELRRADAFSAWFNENLDKPTRLSVSRRPHGKAQAISWLKSSAQEHVAKMRELQRLLEDHGVTVEMIRTSRPGYVVYEDRFQIAAYPFNETET